MRKSLLITSALGFAAVLPTLAMAGSAAGSSAAACGSGFFAQFDAKVLNAKLQIKNKDGSKSAVEADALTSDDDVRKALVDGDLDAISGASWKVLFNYAKGATRGEFLADLLADNDINVGNFSGKTYAQMAETIRAAVGAAAAIFGDPNNPQDAEVGALLMGFNAHDFSAAADAPDDFKKLVADLQTLAADLKKNGKGDNVNLRTGLEELTVSGKIAKIEVANGETIAAAARRTLLNDATVLTKAAAASTYVVVLGNVDGSTFNDAASQQAVKTRLADAAYRTDVLNDTKVRPIYNQIVAQKIADNQKLNSLLKSARDLEVLDRGVHHNALAGGVGATVGWWQNLGGFALSLSGSGDYHWGTFRTVDDKSGETVKAADKRRLGFGFQGDVGAHYVVSPSTTLGVLVGLRGQQLQFGRTDTTSNTDSKDDYASKWVLNPAVSVQARTFFTDNVYGALTVGYIIPMSEKDYNLENTNIDKDAKIRFQGLTGAFSVGMVF